MSDICDPLTSNTSEGVHFTVFFVFQLFKKAKAKGYGEHDMSAVYRAADM